MPDGTAPTVILYDCDNDTLKPRALSTTTKDEWYSARGSSCWLLMGTASKTPRGGVVVIPEASSPNGESTPSGCDNPNQSTPL